MNSQEIMEQNLIKKITHGTHNFQVDENLDDSKDDDRNPNLNKKD